ncbi:MAG: cupredoxin domain-containing protein [Actinomycetota bacterium]
MKARMMMLLVLPVALIACGDDDGGDADAPANDGGGAGGTVLVIEDFTFPELTVEPGATVAVENRDGAPHTVSTADGSFGAGQVDGGATGEFTAPGEPGEYAYFCGIHPDMQGTLVVS